MSARINEFSPTWQDISAVAKAWEDSPYLFIVKVQPLLRGVEDEDIGAEQFSFTSKAPSFPLWRADSSPDVSLRFVLFSES